jgi:hypothetical protein
MRDPWQTRIAGHSMEGAGEIRLKRGRFAAELFGNINRTLLCSGGRIVHSGTKTTATAIIAIHDFRRTT